MSSAPVHGGCSHGKSNSRHDRRQSLYGRHSPTAAWAASMDGPGIRTKKKSSQKVAQALIILTPGRSGPGTTGRTEPKAAMIKVFTGSAITEAISDGFLRTQITFCLLMNGKCRLSGQTQSPMRRHALRFPSCILQTPNAILFAFLLPSLSFIFF